jgi:hypothetical protein
MKKKKFTTSFDELIKNHYGGSGLYDARVTVRVEELFASYYGKSAVWRDRNTPPAVVLSLSCDDGETLAQHPEGKRFEEYVAQHSIANAEFEEYVVEGDALSRQSSIDATAGVLPAEEVSAVQEYQVDVLQPLKEAAVPDSRTAMNASPSEAAFPPGGDGSERQAVAAQLPPSNQETSRAEAMDNEFMADMQAILSGQKVYDPVAGKTTEKDKLGRPQSISSQNDGNDVPAPESKNSQAIFDRIAQSMQYANAYDLGTVELEKRFSDFDKIFEIQQKAAEEKKSKNRQTPATHSSPGAAVDSADFIQDLDAIRKQGSARGAPLEIPIMSSSTAASTLSAAQSAPNEYSHPFYDTGEHVLTGGDLYKDRLRVGKAPGVLFSYGQIIAMADLYESVGQMMGAEVSELTRIKTLIARSTSYYETHKTDRSLDVSDEEWNVATRERYLDLAEENYEHFSPNLLFKNGRFAEAANKHGNNKSAWEQHHKRAIEEAQKMFAAQQQAQSSLFLEWPLIINAFGDHFLTDAFSAGHVINKAATIEHFKVNFFNGKSLKPEGEAFFADVAKLAFKGEVRKKFSVLETTDYPVCAWGYCFKWHPNIDTENVFRKLLIKGAEEQTDSVGNLAVKALHDRLNQDGIEVFNNAGDGTWTLTGDSYLNAKNLDIIRKAVQQSMDNINDPSIFASNLNFGAYFSKVWNHVPQLTQASQKKVVQLTRDYTRPDSEVLKIAAADLISRSLDSLITKLKKQNKLKDA